MYKTINVFWENKYTIKTTKEKNINKVEDLKHQEILLERLIPLYGFLTDKGKDFFNTSEILKNI